MITPSIDSKGVFVTGTDTGVGKTLVSGALAAAARDCGAHVNVFKPCESGCEEVDGCLHARDAAFLQRVAAEVRAGCNPCGGFGVQVGAGEVQQQVAADHLHAQALRPLLL